MSGQIIESVGSFSKADDIIAEIASDAFRDLIAIHQGISTKETIWAFNDAVEALGLNLNTLDSETRGYINLSMSMAIRELEVEYS